jgi:valyl-tRNA synthetase
VSEALGGVLLMLAPVVPHVTEALWQDLFAERTGVRSIGRAPWPTAGQQGADSAEPAGEAAVTLLTAIRRWRSENKVSPGRRLLRVEVVARPETLEHLPAVEADVRAAGRLDRLEATASEVEGASVVAAEVA